MTDVSGQHSVNNSMKFCFSLSSRNYTNWWMNKTIDWKPICRRKTVSDSQVQVLHKSPGPEWRQALRICNDLFNNLARSWRAWVTSNWNKWNSVWLTLGKIPFRRFATKKVFFCILRESFRLKIEIAINEIVQLHQIKQAKCWRKRNRWWRWRR